MKGVARRVDIHNPPLTGTIPSGMRLCRSAREDADPDVHVGHCVTTYTPMVPVRLAARIVMVLRLVNLRG